MAFPKRHSGFAGDSREDRQKKHEGNMKFLDSVSGRAKILTDAINKKDKVHGEMPKGGWTKEQQDAWDNRKMPGGAYSKVTKGSKDTSFAERMKAARAAKKK
jgi:hypothetical protein